MKQNFTLSKSNKIYFGVIAVFSFVLFVAFSDKTPYEIGAFTGRLTIFLLFPSLFAWFVWRLSGKKEKGGRLTFNIVLTLILLGQVGQFGNKLQQSEKLSELNVLQDEFKQVIAATDDSAEIDTAFNKFSESMKDGLNSLSETSIGPEKQFYKIMSEFVTESQTTVQKWRESYNAVLSPRILDYSRLNSDEEFNYQRNILRRYVEEAKAYGVSFASSIPNLKKRLSVLGEGNEYAKGAMSGARERYLLQKPIFEPLMQAHIEYSRNLIQVLDLLQNNKDGWTYENDQLFIDSEDLLNKYHGLIKALGNNEATINTLSEKLVEVM